MAHVEDRRHTGRALGWRVRYIDPAGRERSKSFARKVDADKFRSAVEADVSRGAYTDPQAGQVTLARYAAGWLKIQTSDPSTRQAAELRLRLHILPVLGGLHLAQISPEIVQGWLAGLGVAPAYAKVLLALLSTILNAAVEGGKISRNPCRARSVKMPTVPRSKLVPWEADRVAAVRAALPQRYRVLADLGADCGLRLGEILALSPDDIDAGRPEAWGGPAVHVRRQVKLLERTMVFSPPKGGKERDVPLAPGTAAVIAAHLAQHPAQDVTLPWVPHRETGSAPRKLVTASLIITTPADGLVHETAFGVVWNRALKAAGVPGGRDQGPHALRHHFASVLLFNGVDVKMVQEALGHASAAFTLGVYGHLMPKAPDRMRTVIEAARRPGTGDAVAMAAP